MSSRVLSAIGFGLALISMFAGGIHFWAAWGFHRKWTDWFLIYTPPLWRFFAYRRYRLSVRCILRHAYCIGLFYSKKSRALLIFPVPVIGLRVQRVGCWCRHYEGGALHDAYCPYWRKINTDDRTLLGLPYVIDDEL
jgi:hypothetical protein